MKRNLHLLQIPFFLYNFIVDIKNVQINSQVSLHHQNGKVLKNGSSVLVRILSSKGNGKYEASVAGVKVEVSAKNPLKPGSVFVANVNSRNGSIEINPQQNIKESAFQTILMESSLGEIFASVENPQIQALLSSLGMVSDNLSLSIFNQFKQLGMKIDSSFMNKIYNLALKFKGKEKKAAELMVLLKQKGISFTEDEIQQLLIQLEAEEYKDFDSDNHKFDENSEDKFEIKNFFNIFLKEISDSKNEIGLFTIMNHLGWKKDKSGNGSWVILPFEIADLDKDDKNVYGNGNIKLYLDNLKKLKTLHLNCNYNKKTYNICLEETDSSINIKLHIDGLSEAETNIVEKLKKSIKTRKSVNVEFVMKNQAEGFGAGLEKLILAGGLV